MRRSDLVACLVGGAIALALAGTGCSFSHSSKSSSDSSRNSSKSSSNSSQSSSGSSSPEDSQAREYRNDVADYTEAYVVSGGSSGSFLRGISDLAGKRGVSDWESDATTWEGIGNGLARAKVAPVQLDVYKRSWTDGDAAKMASIERGFEAGP